MRVAMSAVEGRSGISHGKKRKRRVGGEKSSGRKEKRGAKNKEKFQATEDEISADLLMKEISRDEARRRKELFNFNIKPQETYLHSRNKLPQHLKSLMGEANMSFARGQLDETIRLCTEIIRQTPSAAEPFQTLAMVYEDRKDWDKCFEISLIAAHLKRTDVEQWVKLAEVSVERGDLKRAASCFTQAIKHTKGDDVELLWQRAGLYQQLGQRKKAMDDYELLTKVLPVEEGEKLFQVAIKMATIHSEMNNTTKAIEVLQNAFVTHPHCIDPQAINLLAELAIADEKYELARDVICSNCGISCCSVNTENQLTQNGKSSDQSNVEDQTSAAEEHSYACQDVDSRVLTELTPVAVSADADVTKNTELGVMEQLMMNVPQLVSSEVCRTDGANLVYQVPEYLPIDLRAKLVVCLIYEGRQIAAESAALPLESDNPNEIGDIYLDIIDACTKKGYFEWALKWLTSLVQTESFNQAGVWLQHAQCLMSMEQFEEAAKSYEHVVALAPHHLEARLALSSLYQQLNRPDDALQALTQIDDAQDGEDGNEADNSMLSTMCSESVSSEYLPEPFSVLAHTKDYKLLQHKSVLLYEQERHEEFVECGLEMLSYCFRNVYYSKSLPEICLYSDRKARSETRRKLMVKDGKGEGDGESSWKGKDKDSSGLSEEEWWDIFLKVSTTLLHLRRFPELRHLAMACAASFRFSSSGGGFSDNVRLACGLSCLACGEYQFAFEYLRSLCQKKPASVTLWNIMGQLFVRMLDKRTHKFVLRLLLKNPDTEPLLFICGHNSLNASSYRLALATYHRLLKIRPNCPLVLLCIAVSWLSLSIRRACPNRHQCIVQAFAFLRRYLDERQLCQESYYNIARAFHLLDLKYIAVHYYNKVLSLCSTASGGPPGPDSLHCEAAFNLSLIYQQSGQNDLARSLLYRYCTF
ncbi:general transcription factor 3C polypeptide 3-like [Corticium candelabrum]|uniref:general transcription factor 3C polypeptide 3-like n=1 Tax=Corticium candelabrum TaxID=121492 RepID=UPI002E26B7ED|nr:general transcription factor 3C polypeptide 3-like [Corticium candelabrum]